MIEITAWIVGILALLVGIPASYLITLRLARLHSKKMAAGGHRGAGNATPPAGPENESSWYIKHWASIVLVFAGAAIFFWGLYTPGLELKQVGGWSWNHWLPLLFFSGILITLSRLNAKALGDLAKKLETGTIAAGLILFIGFPVWFGIVDFFSPSQHSTPHTSMQPPMTCTSFERCTPILSADGSTELVRTKEGRSLCFDSSFATNLPRLGYVSYYKGVETAPGCTATSCKSDSFRFKPEAGVRLPKYWFVPEGSAQC